MIELRRRRSVVSARLLQLLTDQLADWQRQRPPGGAPEGCDVVDLGGGTGGVASALAELGHRVVVVDPSPDALASLERRTAEAGLDGVRGVQGDAADLATVIGPQAADVVVCHRVLEVVDQPAQALAAIAAVLRPGGVLSLVVSQRHALVLSQAVAGHLAQARRTWADPAHFDYDTVISLVMEAGLTVLASQGVGAIASQVAEALIEAEPGAYDELVALEAAVGDDPAFRAIAPLVHVFAQAPDS